MPKAKTIKVKTPNLDSLKKVKPKTVKKPMRSKPKF